MSGRRYFLDTNAIIALLAGNRKLLKLLNHADDVATSVICELEYLAFPDLPDADRELFEQFRAKVHVIDLCSGDTPLRAQILKLRSGRKMKLPDAIIASSAMNHNSILLTEDKLLLSHEDVRSQSYA